MSIEVEEHVDLDGDNDIGDMMDYEDAMEDYPCRKTIDEYIDGDVCHKIKDEYMMNEGYLRARDAYLEEQHGSEVGGQEEVQASVMANGASSSLDKEDQVGLENEVDSEKYAKLLALPPHGSELFIGGIPRDATEEELRELCEPFGELLELKLMKDKDAKENKGFAFVTFTTKDAACKAIEEIRHKEFKGKTLRCSVNQAKHKLFIGKIPKSLLEEELRKILEECGPGIQNIEIFKDSQEPRRNRGFAFVEYYNHACAEYARQKMTTADFKIDGSTPNVSWADSKSSDDSSAAAQVKAIYLKNLPENVTPEKLKELFEHHGEITKIVLPAAKPGQKRDFGFLHFAERSSALKAVDGTEKYEIDGQVVDAVLARPLTDKKLDHKPGLPRYPMYPPHGYTVGSQPIIIGRGPVPPWMKLVRTVLPDGRVAYFLRPNGDCNRQRRNVHSNDKRDRGSDGNRGVRYHPY